MKIAEIVLIVFGVFLVIDSFFVGSITFDYAIFGLQSIDPFFNHWMLGVILIVIGVIGILFDD